ncbi:MAG: hypothetical protein A4S17_05325 [Proteobacteria bacterium HN_bin10]|nr:MAG: hypothetical protein A4S17_05325 [Proteobacteria bacterium HN_bin10]
MAGLSFGALGGAAAAQTPTGDALDDFGRYLDAAAGLLAEFTLGLRSANARELRRNAETRAALVSLSDALLAFHSSNALLVDDLDDYVRRVSEGGDPPTLWRDVLDQVGRTTGVMQQVLVVVDQTPQLDVALTPEARTQLEDAVAEKGSLLDRLGWMREPHTAEDLARVQAVSARYRGVMERLRETRIVINRILRRRS